MRIIQEITNRNTHTQPSIFKCKYTKIIFLFISIYLHKCLAMEMGKNCKNIKLLEIYLNTFSHALEYWECVHILLTHLHISYIQSLFLCLLICWHLYLHSLMCTSLPHVHKSMFIGRKSYSYKVLHHCTLLYRNMFLCLYQFYPYIEMWSCLYLNCNTFIAAGISKINRDWGNLWLF